MKEDFVTYDQAVKLKELGFGWECNHFYQNNDQSLHTNFYGNFNKYNKLGFIKDEVLTKVILYSAPNLAQVQKWLREKHNIDICIMRSFAFNKSYYYEVLIDSDFDNMIQQDSLPNKTYEDALSAGIDRALELLKTN